MILERTLLDAVIHFYAQQSRYRSLKETTRTLRFACILYACITYINCFLMYF